MKSSKSLNKIEFFRFQKYKPKYILINYMSCSICLDQIVFDINNKNAKPTKFLPCCHFFHKICINEWLDKSITCPECRIPIFIQNSEQLISYNAYSLTYKSSSSRPINDGMLPLLFMSNNSLFPLEDLERNDNIKFTNLINVNLAKFNYIAEYDSHDWIYDLVHDLDLLGSKYVFLLMVFTLIANCIVVASMIVINLQ